MSKVAIIGGGGIRTPLLIHAMARSGSLIGIDEVVLYDIDRERVELVAALSSAASESAGGSFRVSATSVLESAVEGASFVLSSIRVGGIAARARDERRAIDLGMAGQETTGLAGMSMALRTIPVALEHARVVERLAPNAWYINFTNPAGLITQALTTHTALRVIGICDTPSELFHRIALAIGASEQDVVSEYLGLNHLGWVRRVLLDGKDEIGQILDDPAKLRSLYHADLFDPEMIRALGLIPSEYLFFYYHPERALKNQRAAGSSRGEEIERMNDDLFLLLREALAKRDPETALRAYRDYLNRRSGSYMRLEASGEKGIDHQIDEDPFEAATGYHRIALDVMEALGGDEPRRIVVDVLNQGAISELNDDDVVEVPCLIDRGGPKPIAAGSLPEAVRGLVLSVKEYERLTIRAAVEGSAYLAREAMAENPLIFPTQKKSGDKSPHS